MKYFFGLLLAWWLSEPYWGFIEIRLSSNAPVGKNPSQSLCIYKDLKSEFHLCGKDCAQEAHLMGIGLNDPMQTVLKYIWLHKLCMHRPQTNSNLDRFKSYKSCAKETYFKAIQFK